LRAEPAAKAREQKSGATGSRTSLAQRFRAYLGHHRQNARDSLLRLLSAPVQSAMTLLVIAIALALPGMLYMGVINIQALSGSIDTSARMTVFLQPDADKADIDALMSRLQAGTGLASVTYISRDQALEQFRESSGFGEVLTLLDENPLPPVLILEPESIADADAGFLETLQGELETNPLVDDVVLDMRWLQRLQGLMAISQRLVLAMAAILGLGVLLVMGNTIRLAIENRREEILVVKLIGGTNGYVRRPFLYSGFWFGLLGGLLAWLMVWAGIFLIREPVAGLASLYQNPFSLIGPDLRQLSLLLAVGALLGLAGSWLAVAQLLHKIEPE